jgi:methyltransferase FkbM-like protein
VQRVVNVPATTIDSYVNSHRLAHIDLLKIDTQGFDLEVLLGGAEIIGPQRHSKRFEKTVRWYGNHPAWWRSILDRGHEAKRIGLAVGARKL